jgi:hypothetical protein
MAWPFLPQSLINWLSNNLASASPKQRVLYGLIGLSTYVALVSSLRFQRIRKLQKIYPYPTREAMSNMTDHDAWAIQKEIMQMEFPSMVVKSLQFALFRVGNTFPTKLLDLTNRTADIWNSNYINLAAQDIPVLRFGHLFQAIR